MSVLVTPVRRRFAGYKFPHAHLTIPENYATPFILPAPRGGSALNDRICQARENYAKDPCRIQRYRNYAEGCQSVKSKLTEKQQKVLAGLVGDDFADNVCHQIVAEAADRLDLLQWLCPNPGVQKFLSSLYLTSKLRDLQGEVHYQTLLDGNHAVAVGWDSVRKSVRLYLEPWWDGNTGVFVSYDQDQQPEFGVKEWLVLDAEKRELRRRNVWFEDRVERFISADNGISWSPFIPEGSDSYSSPWVKADGTPLHIPYIHFSNPGRRSTLYGFSELDGGVIGFQDQLNDLQMALSGAGRLTAFQMIAISGVDTSKKNPSTGKWEPPDVGAGEVWGFQNSETTVTPIPPGDLSQLLSLYDKKLQRTAQISRTPLHAIKGGDWPSGEALLRAEQPAVGKATRQISRFSSVWVEVAHRAQEIRNRYSGEPSLQDDPEKAPISTRFGSADRRDLLSRSVVIANLKDRISPQESLRMLGYTEAEIAVGMEELYTDMERRAEMARKANEIIGGANPTDPNQDPTEVARRQNEDSNNNPPSDQTRNVPPEVNPARGRRD